MSRLNLAPRKHFLVHFASCVEELSIDERRAPKSQSMDFAILDYHQCRDSLVTCVEKILCNRHECNASVRYPYPAIATFAKESKREVVLELFCLRAEVRLRGMNVLRSCPQSSVFQNCQQILEVTELGQVIHTAYLLYDGYERTIKHEAICGIAIA